MKEVVRFRMFNINKLFLKMRLVGNKLDKWFEKRRKVEKYREYDVMIYYY